MTDYTLKPCPLCGGTNLIICDNSEFAIPSSCVCCQNVDCGCEGGYDLGESGAAEKWNTRPGEDAQQVEIERLNAYIEVGEQVLRNGVALMPAEQLSKWLYVNTWLVKDIGALITKGARP